MNLSESHNPLTVFFLEYFELKFTSFYYFYLKKHNSNTSR